VAVSDGCEKAIRGLVSQDDLVDLFVDVAVKSFAGGTAELLRAFFDGLLGPVAALARPLFAAFLEKVGGRGAVSQFSQKLLEFSQRARAAAQCLDHFDDMWKEAAERARVDVDTLKHVVRQLAGKSEEEIRRGVKELEESLKEVERQLRAISISPDATYFYAGDWLAGREEGGRLKLCNVFMGDCGRGVYVEYVPNPLEEAVVEEVRRRATEGGGLVVVRGAKGIGKSTAVQVALYRVLQLPLKVGDRYYKPVIVAVREYDRDKAERFIHAARGLGLYPIFYLDPSNPRAYPKEPTGPYQPEMSIGELRSVLDKLRDVTGAVAVVVLSNDQYQAVNDLVDNAVVIDADQLLASEKEKYVEALVENYSGCTGEVVKEVATAVVSFDDNYAVAAVLAADWLKGGGCRGEEVEKAIERANGDVHRFALHYLWYGLFNDDEAVARRYAPLLLAVGFFGPHPPKLAKAVVRAFGGEPEDAVVRWFSQPLHGALYEAIRKVAHGAVHRRFSVGSDELCQGGGEGPCRLVEICAEALVGVPRRRYSDVVEVAREYATLVAKALEAPRPAGVRQIDFIINDFLRAFDGVAEDGRWRLRYQTRSPASIKVVEDVVDELDILSALYGLAVLPDWHPRLEPLEDWFFVDNKDAGVIEVYLYPLLRESGKALVKRAVTIVHEAKRRSFYTDMDLWRAVGIAAAGQWDSAIDEELEEAVKFVATALRYFATFSPIVLDYVEPLLSEAWHRVVSRETHENGEKRQRLANWLTLVVSNIARGHPSSLLNLFFAVGIEKSSFESVLKRFDTLYNVASNAGKLLLLDTLLYALSWYVDGVNIAAALLNKSGPEEAFEEAAMRVEEFVAHLHGVERAYVVAYLYPRLATQYASLGRLNEAFVLVDKTLKALNELQTTYEKDRALVGKWLQHYLELKRAPGLESMLSYLNWHVYHHVALVYMMIDELDKAVEYAKDACRFANMLGNVYYEVMSCGLLPRLKAVKEGIPPLKEFEELWQGALQAVEELGAETVAIALGEYVVALVSANRLDDVKKVLEEWGWALRLHPDVSALTYGVLSLLEWQYLEKAVESLPRWARADLPRLAYVLRDAVKASLFANELERGESAGKRLSSDIYDENVVTALEDVARSDMLFLSAFVGLSYCERGKEWGLELAKVAAWMSSQLSKGTGSRLFGELAETLKSATVSNCITDEVLKAVYKLYYLHV